MTVDAFAELSIEAVGDAAADDKMASKRLERPKLQDRADTTGGCIGNAADLNLLVLIDGGPVTYLRAVRELRELQGNLNVGATFPVHFL